MSLRFGRIAEIDPQAPDTWIGQVFLTFDLDWACDAVVADTIDIVEAAGVGATWFITHDTPLLARLRSNPRFELGIHPNFNPLLDGTMSEPATTAGAVVDRLLAVVPGARSVRSHSMTQSTRVLDLFAQRGLTHDCNHFVPEQAKIDLRPWLMSNGLVKVPYFWEDDIACASEGNAPIETLIERDGLRVFDFHPIHVFLNTESIARYEGTRHYHGDVSELLAHRCATAGTRTVLDALLAAARG